MKKTIAKLMAAAMLLSAVPAVTMPSFVSKADADARAVTNTATATVASQFFGGENKWAANSDGEIFTFKMPANTTLANYAFEAVGGNTTSDYRSNIKVSGAQDASGYVHVSAKLDVAKMSSTQKTAFVNDVKAGNNTFKVKVTRDNASKDKDYTQAGVDKSDAFATVFGGKAIYVSEATYVIGGEYKNGKIRTGIADADKYLQDGNVYAVVSKTLSDGIAEVELLKQDNNEANKLKDNDVLRGKKLNLNTVFIGGVEYKVGKLGSQALKEAKMKKVFLKNCSKVGKGALRKCKQLRTVNLKDKNKVRKIHAKAFYDCKNLKSITIDARKLNVVGKDAVGKVKKNCKIKLKASKSKYNDCVKKFKKSGAKNVKYSRLAP